MYTLKMELGLSISKVLLYGIHRGVYGVRTSAEVPLK